MTDLWTRINDAAQFIKDKCDTQPEIGLILGTGLGALVDKIDVEISLSFEEIPHFVPSTAPSHHGNLVIGKLGGKSIIAMQGRVHYYEGYSMQEITLPVRVMKALGAETLIMSNAVGGMNPQLAPGDITIISDQINLMGDNPLIGANDDRLGVRFPDMSEPYSNDLIVLAEKSALELKLSLKRAVYCAVAGPNLETAGEYRYLRSIGADTVGMSIVPECVAAVHSGMKVIGFSVVTDACFPDTLQPANAQDIIKVATKTEPDLCKLVTEVVSRIS
ncbi:purine-nucleoside phosphorylase [bacterium]|jgi:purine-nucleoside phosphorylase|nr:purine-nucleoside phosphorylase [bacterium]MBT4291180.1 purine-nucleoside phosphorylase [bacterium]MBT7310823.1 purine-nucleoside phosphorylase [bacterium]